MAQPSSRSRRRARPVRARGRRRRLRFALAALTATGGAAAVVLLTLYVSVTGRFEGRLWRLPTRVYSDSLALVPGRALASDEIVARLDRSGYARTSAPERPGQYATDGRVLEVHVRPHRTPERKVEPSLLRLRFADDRLASITDRRGRWIDRAWLEPELLATLHGPRQEERDPVPLERIPPALVSAVLAVEDARFLSHAGLDLRGIVRAAFVNLREGRIVQGGSTITQQTVKNLFLGQERTWWRKLREALMSAMLEARYDKDRILEVYLNEVYLGQRGSVAICGVQAAARFYFGRDVETLTLGESALLAGLIKSPGRYNPFAAPDAALDRRDRVLDALEQLATTSAAEIAAARGERLVLASGAGGYADAAHAVSHVRAELERRLAGFELERDGLVVHTTIDTSWQRRGTDALRTGLARLERDSPSLRRRATDRSLEGAVLVTDPRTGAVLAMVGGRDYATSQFNRATQARRQPGSCFKPFVFAAGFEQANHTGSGLTPASLLEDEPLVLEAGGVTWRPRNHDGTFRGPVTVRDALELSLNVPTVRAAQQVGLDEVIAVARRCGLRSPLAEVPSLALGTAEVTPLELATAYATWAAGGVRHEAWTVREVLDREGRPVELEPRVSERAVSAETAGMINGILQGVLVRGTARSAAALGYTGTAAGKTGTTDDTRDAWFVGYTPELLALVWVGFDDGERTGLSGTSGALPIWVDLMRAADAGPGFEGAAGLVQVRICPKSGGRALRRCPEAIVESFPPGQEPQAPCDQHEGALRRFLRRAFD
jgi:penicillin-binding protein 1B